MAKKRSRSAEATIRGFMYQFDATILKILSARTNETVVVEGIEDVDVLGANRVQAIQCKYYEGTALTNSELRKIVTPMLEHFKKETREISYYIYGYFKSANPFPLNDTTKFKTEILAYKKKDVAGNIADDLGITEPKLTLFLKCLKFEYTGSFTEHQAAVSSQLEDVLRCTAQEVEVLYYPNAMSVVEHLAVQSTKAKRTITKEAFIKRINVKNVLFSRWCLEEQGREKFCRKIHKQYFSKLNISPYNRFFIIEVADSIKVADLKMAILEIGNKWSTASKGKRTKDRCAPYICLRNFPESDLTLLKNQLYIEGHRFVDGFPFKGANFQMENLTERQTLENKYAFRFVDEPLLNAVVDKVAGTKEIYEFYRSFPTKEREDIKHVRIPIGEINDIGQMV